MTAPQTEATTDPQSIITALQQRLDAALAREAALADELAAQAAEMATRAAELADRKTEFDERIEHQAATADVLRVMSASPGDTQPVFDLIVRRAAELCNAQSGGLFEYDGERVHIGTIHGLYEHDGKLLHVQSLHGTEPDIAPASLAAYLRQFPMPPKRGSISMRAILDCQIMHIRDMQGEVDLLEDVQRLGHRSQVSLPLLRNARAIGVITIAAHEPGGFSESQIALLKTFAEQAVIAITSAETYRALQTRTGDLQETLEYQTATSDVLKVISGSEFDLAPVFQAVVETAARLCHADQATIYRYQDGDYRWVAGTSLLPDYERIERGARDRPGTGTLVGRVTLEGRTVQIPDAWTDPLYELKDDARVGGVRTMLGVPLLRDGAPIGVIGLARKQIEPFTDRQIELVSTFADQAVIAIENTRLITEQREALEQQTATAEVLQVINASPGNLTPVFDAMLEKAMRLCGAAFGLLFTYDGEKFHMAATRGATAALAAALAEPWKPTPGGSTERLIRGLDIWQISDIAAPEWYDPDNKGRLAMADLGGGRSTVWVALRKDDAFRGVIMIYRQEVRPFTDRQIALLQNFAAQAVIAMENARLINEQREALEQQTATAEVLQVINASPGNLAPVFDAMLEKAMRLSGAAYGVLRSYDGEHLHMLASRGVPTEYAEFLARSGGPGTPGDSPMPGTAPMRALETRQPSQRLDVRESIGYTSGIPGTRAIADLGGARTCLHVPLVKDQVAVGLLTFYRQEVRAFSDKQIALLQNFAAQAVIAIENARLITEQREALEQQTATAEVLQVINASPGNLAPVFDAILQKAHDLCDIAYGDLQLYNGESLHSVAQRGLSVAFADRLRQGYRASDSPATRPLLAGDRFTHIIDAAAVDSMVFRSTVQLDGIRTVLFVPLRKDGSLLGMITSARREVRPFTEKEIALLENFAAQAVIAMENALLLTEQQEALERQTATAEVLGVINASPGNLTPVFDAMLEKAMRLCGAAFGSLYTYDGEHFHSAAQRGVPPAYAAFRAENPPLLTPSGGPATLLETRRPLHVLDLMEGESYRTGNPGMRAMVELGGIRTILTVPLIKDDAFLGVITIYRQEVRAFTDKQIALLQNFAAQAVIAMENARLLAEQQEALEQQTATAEVLQVINANPGDLTPVFDAILDKAHTLCGAVIGSLVLFDGTYFRAVATHGWPNSITALFSEPAGPNRARQRLVDGERFVQVADIRAIGRGPNSAWGDAVVESTDARTMLLVPLRKDGALLGFISAFRPEVRAFSDKEIALLENFAAQAVIAMENARLISEQREALEQQTATAEVLQVTNASPGNLAPVFDAILEKAHSLCRADHGSLYITDGETFRAVALRGMPDAFADLIRQPFRPGPNHPVRQLIAGAPFAVVRDALQIDDPIIQNSLKLAGMHSALFVPLRKDKVFLGYVVASSLEVQAFGDKHAALLQNFAAQAVIAMENARLINEQREALEQQTATAEVLQVINASPGNLTPVFDTILDKAMRLCGAAFGSLYTYDGEGFRSAAHRGVPGAYAEWRGKVPPSPRTAVPARILAAKRSIHVIDVMQEEEYKAGEVVIHKMVELGGIRTALSVPLLKDDVVLGFFTIFRQEVQAFSNKQIALLENFATQAVIAMENARLLDEIRQRQEELRVTFENMGDGVAMFDETQHLAAWNRKFQDILDVPDEALAARPTFVEYIRYLTERGEFGQGAEQEEQLRRIQATRGRATVFERTRPNGRVIEVRHNPVAGGGFVLIYADITERKRSEEEIRAARDAAEEAGRTIEAAYRDLKAAQANLIQAEKMASLGQLTAGIAHEIKNPLNFVNNFAELSVDLLGELKDAIAPAEPALTEQQRAEIAEVSVMLTSNLEKITEHGKRADGIVKAMLEHSRGSSGERRMVDLNALIDEALNLAYHGARAQDQSFNITLERDFGEGIAPIAVNPQDITRVFLNLFSNGFYATTKRTRDGGDTGFVPTLKVTTIDAGEAVEIRVRDNGTGIPADIRDKLFQPFFTTKPTGEGTGLGLSITYDIVTQQHGGSIAVDSKVGEYSEFTIRLPRNP